ncbi:hypothetical protein [Pedobacter sp. JCM 36344]|uniref:hypothetical protein n=1 Tax=Pedobacter sp. JCM 36344 TaxID=3374280 RepID=UPI00397A0E69
MRLAEHKDLKAEIKSLPEKEKDKLLLRLIAKDKVLTEHLHFMLLENEEDLNSRFQHLREHIDEGIKELNSARKGSSKDILLKIRKLSGSISHHQKVTKNTMTEIELRIHLLKDVPIDFKDGIFSPMYKFNEKLFIYYVKAVIALLNKFKRLHEDIQFDMKVQVNVILKKIYTHKTAVIATELGLPNEI